MILTKNLSCSSFLITIVVFILPLVSFAMSSAFANEQPKQYPKNRFLKEQTSQSTLIKPDWDRTEIVLIRHGESFNNCIYGLVRERFGESLTLEEFEAEINKLHEPDCGLSPKGERQAQALGEYLREKSLEMISDINLWSLYTSPMKRCLLTAQQVSRAFHNKTVFVHPRLFESDGCYQANRDGTTTGLRGMSKHVVEEKFPNFRCLPGMEDGWFHLPRKETRKEFYERTLEIVDFLWTEHFRIHSIDRTADGEGSIGSKFDEMDTATTQSSSRSGVQCSNKPKQGGIMIIAHGNIIASTISYLLGTNALITNCNTGISHLQLWTHRVTRQKLVSLSATNRVPHFQNDHSLHGGEQIFEDHWIQEFLAPEDS